jgi:hypothetical protein
VNGMSRIVVLYDPAVSSLNMGDHIISDACENELSPLLDNAFVVRISSHLPVSKYMTYIGAVDNRFVCGSNLLRGRMNSRFRQWEVTPRTVPYVGPVTLVGVGWWQYSDEINAYTRWLYRKLLEPDIIHSVRDAFTEARVRSLGLEAINTSCPTMWKLTEEHCSTIPADRGHTVVTTVTDYAKDPARDRSMLLTLAEIYPDVRIWLQGAHDAAYLASLELPWHRFDLIPPDLARFCAALGPAGTDYVGTRLHAGICALQHGRRSLIIGVDNRAAEIGKNFNIPWLPRADLSRLAGVVNGQIATTVRIPEDRIAKWKSQFPAYRTQPDAPRP